MDVNYAINIECYARSIYQNYILLNAGSISGIWTFLWLRINGKLNHINYVSVNFHLHYLHIYGILNDIMPEAFDDAIYEHL